jgi:AcrR family transcriptional regulator
LTPEITALYNAVISNLTVTRGKETAKASKRERARSITRERILDAAEKLFLERGFAAATVQDIAVTAGYTTGAIYSNFGGKAHLFLAVMIRRWDPQEQIWRDALESATTTTDAAAAMGVALGAARYEPEWYAAMFEFFSFAARHEDLRRETAELLRGTDPIVMDILADVATKSPLPLERLAAVITGLMRGLAWTWVVDPDAADNTLFSDAVAVLIGASPSSSGRKGPKGSHGGRQSTAS